MTEKQGIGPDDDEIDSKHVVRVNRVCVSFRICKLRKCMELTNVHFPMGAGPKYRQ